MGRLIRIFLLCLIGTFVYPVMTHCQEIPAPPLTVDEMREVLGRLQELQVDRQKLKQYQAFIDRDQQQDAREAALNAKALELAQKDKEAMEKERDFWKEKADYYKEAYDILAKKRGGVGCTLAKLFTLWLYSCGG